MKLSRFYLTTVVSLSFLVSGAVSLNLGTGEGVALARNLDLSPLKANQCGTLCSSLYQAPDLEGQYRSTKKAVHNSEKVANTLSSHRRVEVGLASWYGRPFHGRKTASGTIYNMYALTAAHKNLRLNAHIQVTNLRNNKAVILKVTDRGPYVGQRILDVSYAAAQKLGFTKSGTAPVRVEVID
ncbi:MAG: septal ring lytic transglycosylase RlpA family protein [Neisseriaceae bacterium]